MLLIGSALVIGGFAASQFFESPAAQTDSAQPASRAQTPATQRMVARLLAIAEAEENAPPEAANVPFASNRPRYIAALRQRLPSIVDPLLRYGIRFEIAQQLLFEGSSLEALVELEALEDLLPEVLKLQPPEQRPAEEALLQFALGMAGLRVGEQENCLMHHTALSCIFPITGDGVHALQRGARRAIEAFTKNLEVEPTSLAARWLLNLAYMTVGEYPAGVPPQWLIAPEAFASEYDPGRFSDISTEVGLDIQGLAGGGIVDDFDGDGLLDVVASSAGLRDQIRFMKNDGGGRFVDRTAAAGLTGLFGGLNITHADYDNDGDPDLLVLRGAWRGERGLHPSSLLRNNGDGTFDDVTEEAGLMRFHPTQVGMWADFDNDGFLDLFIGNEEQERGPAHPSELFRNNGDGTFTNIAAASGVANLGFVKGAAWGDYNNDGRPDLYVARFRLPNLLFRNDGPIGDGRDAWRFTDVTDAAGVPGPLKSFPTWFFDYDNDGWLDIFVGAWDESRVDVVAANYLGRPWPEGVPRLYRNKGDGTFEDVTEKSKIGRVLLAMGANYGDLDNDGFLDMYIGTGGPDYTTLMPNRMFRNAGDGTFQDVTTAGGFGHLQKGHAVSFADVDHDGDQDVHAVIGGWLRGDTYQNVLFENPGHGNHWLSIELQGTRSNRMAIGARLKATVRTADGMRDIRGVVSTGGSFGGNPARHTLGLGRAEELESLEVIWPASGQTQRFTDLPMDQFIRIREGAAAFEPIQRPGFALAGPVPAQAP